MGSPQAEQKLYPFQHEQPYPDMLKMGRTLRVKTQRELAEETGIDQSLISKYENGTPIPDGDLSAIASALELPEKFFFKKIDTHAASIASELMFRKRRTTPAKYQHQIIAEMNRIAYHVGVLFESVDVKSRFDLPIHEPEDGFMDEVENIADRVRLELHIPPGPIPSMIQILESMSVVVVLRKLPAKIDALVDNLPKPPILLLSQELLGGRRRFTLAHELGHMVMHKAFLKYTYDELEEQANRFASAFLMPAKDIKSKLRGLTMEKLIALSSEWRVSVQALVRRAYDLEVIDQRRYRFLNERLGKNGYRTTEPVEIHKEKPTLLSSLIRLHMNELKYSTEELAGALAMLEWEFKENYLPDNQIRVVKKKPVFRL